MAYEWDVAVGDVVMRETLKARYGGSPQGGIAPSKASPNVLIFSDLARGHQHGYVFDGWVPNEQLYLYTGEGPRVPSA